MTPFRPLHEIPLLPEPRLDESPANSRSPIDSVEFEVKLSSQTTASSKLFRPIPELELRLAEYDVADLQ